MFSPRLLAGLLCLFSGTAQVFAQSASCTYTFFQHTFAVCRPHSLRESTSTAISLARHAAPKTQWLFGRPWLHPLLGQQHQDSARPKFHDTQFNRRNASGVTVGQMGNSKGTHGVVYYNGTWRSIDFPGAAATTLTGINKYGTIVGNWTDGNGHSHAFRLKNGTFIQFKQPERAISTPRASATPAQLSAGTQILTPLCISMDLSGRTAFSER